MRTELPAERLHRRLGANPDIDTDVAEDDDPDEDTQDELNSLLPQWISDTSGGQGWVARVRADPGRAGVVALMVVAVLAVLVTIFTLVRDRPAPVMSAKLPPVERVSLNGAKSPGSPGSPAGDRSVVVSVVGLVRTPGLVTLTPGARIADALQAAGGTIDGADTIGLNMARQLGDGEQIVVGLAPSSGQPTALGSSVSTGMATGPVSGSTPSFGRSSGRSKPGDVLDLNTASVEQLDNLPGVGPVTAAAIVVWRQHNGRFTSVDQLADVDGIGPARLNKLRALVRV